MKTILFTALLLISVGAFSQNDSATIKMYINLEECSKNFKVYYGEKLLFESGNSSSEDTLISFFAAIGNGQMPIEVFKKGWFGYHSAELPIYYVPNQEYLVLYRNYRVKRRYFFDARWVNFLPQRIDNLK